MRRVPFRNFISLGIGPTDLDAPFDGEVPGWPLGPAVQLGGVVGPRKRRFAPRPRPPLASRRNSFETDHNRAQQCFAFYSRAVLRIKVRARVTPKDDE